MIISFETIKNVYRKIFPKKKPYGFGYIPDKKDDRDIIYKVHLPGVSPPTTNRRNIKQFPYRYDQGNLGSCVGQSVSAAFRHVLHVNRQPDFDPSRLFAYYIAREDKLNDTGARIRDAFKAINRLGLCGEPTWPYIISRFAIEPTVEAYAEALDHQSIRYERVPQTKEAIMEVISQGYPIVYGKQLFSSFTSDKVKQTGIIPMPKCFESRIGGHAMTIFDYDETGTVELNSWGDNWGQAGVCHVPWKYVLDSRLCSDFWVFYLTE